ncbi:MBL fold metallo-hydrolase [soil metagenome]
MKIYPLSEGKFTVDQSKQFIPFNVEKDNLRERSKGSLLVEIQPFVVVTSRDIILLDTGLGFENSDGEMQILANLRAVGIDPENVSKVLISHLHKDHAGGILMANKTKPGFQNAIYYINSQEWELAFSGKSSSFFTRDFEALRDSDQLILLEGNGTIEDYIAYQITGGHSQFHQVFTINEDSEIIFFAGDEAPQLQQMKHKFKAKYDFDGEIAMELREKWWKQGTEADWTFLFYHDIANPSFKASSA